MINVVERLTVILHDTDLAMRMATLRLREAAKRSDFGAIDSIQWVGTEYRLAYNNKLCRFSKTEQGEWRLTDDKRMYLATWPITVKGVFAELVRMVQRRNVGMLLLLGAGLGAGITPAEWAHLLSQLAPARPPLNPCLMPLSDMVPIESPAPSKPPVAPTRVPTKPAILQRHAPVAQQPALFVGVT